MRRVVVRHSSPPAWAIAAGLGLGLALGFALGEVAGPVAGRALAPATGPSRTRPSVAELVYRAQAALDDDLPLRECRLKVIPIGPGRLELHGWVNDRRARARAERLVYAAVDADALVNCLLVRGDDDLIDGEDHPDERLA